MDEVPHQPADAAPSVFNPLFAIGGVVILLLSALLVATGLLVPLAVMFGLLAAFIGVQALIFRLFPPTR